jgi:hypothetical protein
MREKKLAVFAAANTVGLIAVLTVNYLANALPIGGFNTGELSDMYPNLFVPSGFTFSIWGIIYALLAAFTVYSIVAAVSKRDRGREPVRRVGLFFFLSSLANIGWIFTWHYRIVWASLLFMLLILGLLIALYLRLDIRKREMGWGERLLAAVPFSIYLGWITVATVANVTALLVDLGWGGFGFSEQVWMVIVLAAVLVITLAVLFTRQDIWYSLVAVWALYGILMKRLRLGMVFGSLVVAAVLVCLGLIVIGIVIQAARRQVY